MSSAPIIRPAEPSDLKQWSLLWDGYNEFYERAGPSAIPDEVTQTTWDRFFDPNEPIHCHVAELDGSLVGLVHFLFHRNTVMINQTCYLQDLFTNSELRGKGIGRALIMSVYDRAREANCPVVYWHTHRTNETAMKLYDKVADNSGFVLYKEII